MANEYYENSSSPATGSQLSSAIIRSEFGKVEQAMDKLPVMSTSAGSLVAINATGTALEATSTPVISGGSINGTPVGSVVPASGAFTTLSASSTATAPTVATDNNTTAVATTAFVLGQASATTPVMDGVAAVGASTRYARADHVHASDTAKANLASPAFSGVPTAPTAAADANTTQLATTAFVLAQAASTAPSNNGTAAQGSSLRYARADHVHATDTTRAPVASPTFTGTVTLPNTGAGANDAATKSYVDTVAAAGLDVHTACDYATTANINLATNNLTAIDGTVLTAGMRVLVKNQTTTTENGLYTVVNGGAWTRTADADASGEIKLNSYVFVNNGTANAKTGWTQQTAGTIIPGTNAMSWTQFSSSQSYTNGTGLSLAGNVFSLTTPVSVANGGTGVATSTGSGANVLATSPTLVTPLLGTPTSGVLTNATGLPLATGVTGLLPVANGGTGVSTAQAEMNRVAAAVTSGQYLRGNGTNVVMSAIQAADVPTLNQNTTGSAASAATATNLASGVAGAVHWQSGAGVSGFTAAGTSGYILTSGGATVPTWTAQSALAVGSATTATRIAAGVAGAIPFQSGVGVTGFSAAGTVGQVLTSNGAGAPTWVAQSSIVANSTSLVSKTSATGSAILPVGTTAQRDAAPLEGYLRYNNTLSTFEGYAAGWKALGGAASGANSDITSLTGLTSAVNDVRQLQPITAAIASNAITITPSALSLEFRNTTLTNGAVTFVKGTPAALVIAATDSFGLVTAYGKQRLAILAINNAGTIELAASALYGGASLDETGVITTATTSTTATGIKAAAVRSGVAYRVIGFVDATFTTATGWGSLALVQGAGGNAATSLGSLGYGQTWQSVIGSRAAATLYYNTTGRPIMVAVNAGNSASSGSFGVSMYVNGLPFDQYSTQSLGAGNQSAGIIVLVPPGATYQIALVSATLDRWNELR